MTPSEHVDPVTLSLNHKGVCGNGFAPDRFGEAEYSWNYHCHKGAGCAKPWADAVRMAAGTPWQQ
jgi:hypothetical protein